MTQVTDQIQPTYRSGQAQATPRTPAAGSASSLTESVTTYIPTEVVTAYVAVIGALHQSATHSRTPDWVVFYVFLVIAPLAVLLSLALKEKTKGLPLPIHPRSWPAHTRFNLIAATVSFGLWGFSLPQTPFQDFGWYQTAYGTAALVIGTLLLGMVSPLFQWDAEARHTLAPSSPADNA
jgi:RsiW-degrading membrane proteinase PrsW (M82 family)